jgi:hypothetical protein
VVIVLLYAATGDGIAQLEESGEWWTVAFSLPESGAQCLAVHPADPDTVYAGSCEGVWLRRSRVFVAQDEQGRERPALHLPWRKRDAWLAMYED